MFAKSRWRTKMMYRCSKFSACCLLSCRKKLALHFCLCWPLQQGQGLWNEHEHINYMPCIGLPSWQVWMQYLQYCPRYYKLRSFKNVWPCIKVKVNMKSWCTETDIYRQTETGRERQTDRVDGWIDREADWLTDRLTERDRQTDRYILDV